MDETMTKDQAFQKVKDEFKGNDRFIAYCESAIATSGDFVTISKSEALRDNWSWEKFLTVTIETESGFKMITYRKGNERYSPENVKTREGNHTSEIHDYRFTSFVRGQSESDSYVIEV